MKAFSKAGAMRHWPTLALLVVALSISACSSTARKDPAGKPAAPPKASADKADAEGRFKEALELMKSNQPQEAEQAFVTLSKDFPNYAGPWTNLGILYAKSKRRDLAVSAFTRAAQLNPNNAVAFNWLGILSREGGDYARAKLAYEKALQITPDDPLTRLNYAILLDQYLKQPQEAIAQYQRYQQLAPKEDLRVMAWVAELEAKIKATAPPPAAAPAVPAAAAPAPVAGKSSKEKAR